MKRILIPLILLTSLSACDPGESMREKSTQDPAVIKAREIAAKNGCMGCHTVTNSVMGPAWRLVAERYKGIDTGKALIIQSIKNGSKGRWPEVSRVESMPSYKEQISEADLELLANYILSLK